MYCIEKHELQRLFYPEIPKIYCLDTAILMHHASWIWDVPIFFYYEDKYDIIPSFYIQAIPIKSFDEIDYTGKEPYLYTTAEQTLLDCFKYDGLVDWQAVCDYFQRFHYRFPGRIYELSPNDKWTEEIKMIVEDVYYG